MSGLLVVIALALGADQGVAKPAGSLKTPRSGHTATLLNDGRVLVVGGRGTDATVELASVEAWSPKARRFEPLPPLTTGRSGHTATVLPDGRVVVLGGVTRADSQAGSRLEALASSEVFDPKSNTWSPGPSLLDARNWHTATLVDDAVLVIGGAREQRSHLASVEKWRADAGPERLAPLPLARCLHQAVADDGGVVVVGGRSNQGQTVGAADAGLDGLLPAAAKPGDGFGVPVAWAARYSLEKNAWSVWPETTDARQRHDATFFDGKVTVVGGATTHGPTNLVEWFAGGSEWGGPERSLPYGLAGLTVTAPAPGSLVVIGGEPPNQVDSAQVLRFDGTSGRWCAAGTLKASRKMHTATRLADGRILVIGGLSAGIPEGLAELWEPKSAPCSDPPQPTLEW